MKLSLLLLLMTAFFYAIAFLFHFLSFSGIKEGGHRPGFALMRIGFLIATFYLAAEAIDHGFFLPVANFAQAMAFFGWSLAFIYLVLLVRIQSESFGLVLSPILLLLTCAAAIAKYHLGDSDAPLDPMLQNSYFTLHILGAFFAYACFTLSFAAGLLYLIQYHELKAKHAGHFYHKLPSLEELERLVCQPLLWGTPLLCGAIAVGFIWSKSVYGEFWIFDPKTIATVVTILIYGVMIYLRYISTLRGKQFAVLTMIAFAFVVFSFVGTRFIQGGHHYLQ